MQAARSLDSHTEAFGTWHLQRGNHNAIRFRGYIFAKDFTGVPVAGHVLLQ